MIAISRNVIEWKKNMEKIKAAWQTRQDGELKLVKTGTSEMTWFH